MKQMFSKIIFSLITLIIIFVPNISFGQNVPANPQAGGVLAAENYKAITPGGFFGVNELKGDSVGTMLQTIFRISITISIILAVLMLIIGGLEYMSESVFKKTNGVERIKAALLGLLIALISILILTTVFGGENQFSTPLFESDNIKVDLKYNF